jgi:uncharacterized iron-regulated membrane protein
MRKVRFVVFWLHLSVGCLAGLVILAMSVTGVLLAFERQINTWMDAPAVLQGQSDETAQAPLDSLLAALKNSGQGIPSQLVLHNSPYTPVEARFGRERTLYLNPWTAEVIGQPSESTRAFFGTVERVHRSLGLGMQSAFGRGITGAANLAFMFMLLSGMYLWLPKVFNLTSLKSRLLFRRGLGGKAREWNWHNVIGIWTAIPLFFIVLSGVVMSYPWASNLLFTMTGTRPPSGGWRGERPPQTNRGNHVPAGAGTSVPHQFRSLDELAQAVKQQTRGWKSITIEVPQSNDAMLNVSIDESIGGQPERVSQVVMSRQSGHVEAIKKFSDNSAGRMLRAWARFLHTGEEFGILGESIAALACVGAIMLVWTGLSMAIRRGLSTPILENAFVKSTNTRAEANAVSNMGRAVNS